jgi:hypothetical protein
MAFGRHDAGFMAATIYASFILTGGNLLIPPGIHVFDYIGPLGLILALTSAKGRLNQAGREISASGGASGADLPRASPISREPHHGVVGSTSRELSHIQSRMEG